MYPRSLPWQFLILYMAVVLNSGSAGVLVLLPDQCRKVLQGSRAAVAIYDMHLLRCNSNPATDHSNGVPCSVLDVYGIVAYRTLHTSTHRLARCHVCPTPSHSHSYRRAPLCPCGHKRRAQSLLPHPLQRSGNTTCMQHGVTAPHASGTPWDRPWGRPLPKQPPNDIRKSNLHAADTHAP